MTEIFLSKAKEVKEAINKSDIPDNFKYYWGYQFDLGVESIVSYLIEKNAFQSGFKVCEIGSAEGGVLHAFSIAGAGHSLGTDIAVERIEMGDRITKLAGLDVEYTAHDILFDEIPEKWQQNFDLVLLRDVIEHLDDTKLALANIRKIIKPGGHLFVTFPPYNSPYGGHQHTVAGKLGSKFPYIHLLPQNIFHKLISTGRPQDIEEVKRLEHIKLNAKKFTDAALDAGYSIANEDFYLLRPVFKMKFGLPTIKLTPISKLPLIKNYLTLEAAFLLKS
jgi:SAM-dependent methyltransferase